MRAAWIVLLLVILVGCSSEPQQPPAKDPPASTTETTGQDPPATPTKDPLFEQLHSGLFQADAAVKKLSDALDTAKEIEAKSTGNLATYLKETMVPVLDDSGASLADISGGEAPTEEQVKQDHQKFQAKRDTLVNQINDLLKDMHEQSDAADDMATTAPPETLKQCKHLNELLGQIIDDLTGALTALGAKEDKGQGTPDTGDTNQKPPPGFDPNSAGTTR